MDPDEIKNLAQWVQEHAGEHRGQGWFDWVKRDDESEHEVKLSDPIPIDIHD